MRGVGKIAVAFVLAITMIFAVGCGGAGDSDDTEKEGGIDMANFPLYTEDTSSLSYSNELFEEKRSQPYWYGNVMYNEIALPVLYDDGSAYANLLYAPERIISVMDQKLKKTYVEGADYTVDGQNKRLVIPEGSAIELIGEHADAGVGVPSGYELSSAPDSISKYVVWNRGGGPFVYTESSLFYGRYLSVTYSYDIAEIPAKDVFNTYDRWSLAKVRAKLESGQDISLAVLGDSISEGSSSTGDNLHVEPYGPCYATQLKKEIERIYGVNVNLVNSAKGGTLSDWITSGEGAAALVNAKTAVPDLCVIAYGMNDATGSDPVVTASRYGNNIKKAIDEIRGASEDCEFILVNSFPCNPLYEIETGLFTRYLNKLNEIAGEYDDGMIRVVDMQKVGNYMLGTKKYCEISSSNVNHPNDFFHRVYAMNIMTAIYDYKSSK